MAMANEVNGRRVAIAKSISLELERQGVQGVDAEALAAAVDEGLDADAPLAEGKRPEDLNSANDD